MCTDPARSSCKQRGLGTTCVQRATAGRRPPACAAWSQPTGHPTCMPRTPPWGSLRHSVLPPPQPSLICLHPHWKSPSTTPAASEPTGGGRSSQLWVWLLLVPPRGSPRLCPAVSGSPHTAVSLRLGLVGTAIFKTMLQWASLIRLEFILVWVSFEVGTCAFHTGFSSLASEHLVSSFA